MYNLPSLVDDVLALPTDLTRLIARRVHEEYHYELQRYMNERKQRWGNLHFEMGERMALNESRNYKCDHDGYFRRDALLYRQLNKAIYVDQVYELHGYDTEDGLMEVAMLIRYGRI